MITELHEKLDRLERHAWNGQKGSPSAVLSVYINLAPVTGEAPSASARLKNLLEPIAAESGSFNHDARMAMRKAIARVLELEPKIATSLGKCVAVFVNGTNDFEEIVTLPHIAWDVAVSNDRPYLRPYLASLDAVHTVATMVVDPRRSEIFVTRMGETLDHSIETSEPIRKPDFGGWHGLEEYRTRNRTEQQHARIFKAVSKRLSQLHVVHHFEAVFIGGRDETIAALLPHLSEVVRPLVTDTFHVDAHTTTPAMISAVTTGLEEQLERRLEQELVDSTLEFARAGGMGVVGLADTLMASNLAAIDHLVVAGSAMEVGWVCGNCGWLALSGPTCQGCGGNSTEAPDVIELAVGRSRRQKAKVEHVLSVTELDKHRMAAKVRFHPVVTTGENLRG